MEENNCRQLQIAVFVIFLWLSNLLGRFLDDRSLNYFAKFRLYRPDLQLSEMKRAC